MPNDGWSGAQIAGGNGDLFLNPAVLGTYTYSVNCVQGSISAQASVTVTVENNPPYATLSVSSSLVSVGQTVSVTYKSNMAGCILDQNLVGTQNQGVYEVSRTGGSSDGTNTYTASNAGESQFTFVCNGENNVGPPAVSATPQTITVQEANPLTATISAPANAVTGTPFTVSWQTANATACGASGGGADGSSWSGTVSLPSGQITVTPTVVGSFTYVLTCIGQSPIDTMTVQATVNVTAASPPPSGGSSGSHGGGGAISGMALGFLALAKVLGIYRRKRVKIRRHLEVRKALT